MKLSSWLLRDIESCLKHGKTDKNGYVCVQECICCEEVHVIYNACLDDLKDIDPICDACQDEGGNCAHYKNTGDV